MLNQEGNRELAYLVKIRDIQPIVGADRVEKAIIGGWQVMVRKNQFQIGDIAIYFEIDSKVPEKEPFMFLEPKHFQVKTQKYFKGTVISQGLLMSLDDFIINGKTPNWVNEIKTEIAAGKNVEYKFLTETLGVTYAVPADNARKAATPDKYTVAKSRHPRIFKQRWAKWLMRRAWGRKILLKFFATKRDRKQTDFPQLPFISKSDEERCENLPVSFLEDKTPYRKTLKIDGTSTLFLLERKRRNKYEFWVCSRNKRVIDEQQKTYQDTNVYWEMAKKYDVENKLKDMLIAHPEWDYVAIQGETAGVGCQGNPHKLPETRFYAFNFIDSVRGRWDSVKARDFLKSYDILFVPIVDENYILPDDFEEFKQTADGPIELKDASGSREGYVYRSSTDPYKSFKNVSRKYLLKHNG